MSLFPMGVCDGSHEKNKEIFSRKNYDGYFCLAMPCKFLCLDLNKSECAPDNPKCYKLTRDLSPIAAERAIDIVGAKPVKINGETYFVGGQYSFNEAKYSLKPDLYRLRLQQDKKDTAEFLLLEPGFGPDAVGFPPSLNAVKVNPIVAEIGEKSYVLHTGGGGRRTLTNPVFEAFDHRTCTWSALPDPPFLGDGCYSLESFVSGHSVIGERLFVITARLGCAFFDTKEGEWHVLPPFVPSNRDAPPPRVGRILLWPRISCGTQSSIRVGKDHYICFVENSIYLVDSGGIVLGEQRNAFDAIFKDLARPFSCSYTTLNGMTFIPCPHIGTLCAAVLNHELTEEEENMPTLCISFFRPVINTSVVNSILDGSYLDANPDSDYTNLNLVDVQQDHGFVFDFSEHFDDDDDITDLGFCGPAFLI